MATNSDIPVGFQIAGIFIPVVAAIVTGILALVTGRKHTTEWLKNLEASKELPETLNVKHAMERVMLTYVRDIDRYASSWFRNSVKLSGCARKFVGGHAARGWAGFPACEG